WDGGPSTGTGGTADIAAAWRRRGLPFDIVSPLGPQPVQGKPVSELKVGNALNLPVGFTRAVRAVVFMDAKGFSELTERDFPHFHREFLERIAQLIAASSERPEVQNTWGDAA